MLRIERREDNFVVTFRKVKRFNTIISSIVEKQLVQLLDTPGTNLLLDLEGIHFIDSTGFDTLLTLHQAAKTNKANFLLCNISADVEELLRLVGLREIFQIIERDELVTATQQ
jgi:anti-anti-sigma factor